MRGHVLVGLALALACSPLISSLPAAAAPAQSGMGSPSQLTSGTRAAPNPNQGGVNPANSTLTGISCVTTSFCVAVGWTFEGEDQSVQISTWSTLAETWNGSRWSVIPTPATQGGSAQLFAVSCTTTTACEAVGYDSGVQLAIGESWDGRQWHLQPTPDPGGINTITALEGIACTSSTSCKAVGWAQSSSALLPSGPLVEQWNGTAWTIQPSAPINGGYLDAISCSAADACTAVGSLNGAFAERWNGVAWTLQPAPASGGVNAVLAGVSCPTARFCMAVGVVHVSVNGGDTTKTMGASWNGTAWSMSPTPQPSGAARSTFNAVTCASSAACTAVGGSDVTGPLVATWNGTRWVRQSTPDRPAHPVAGQEISAVNAVWCRTKIACIGVGYLNQSSLTTNLLGLISNGHGWQSQTMPEPINASSVLAAVACPTSKECIAVGRFDTPTFSAPIAETRSGGIWVIHALPWPDNVGGAWMMSISCPSAAECIAVGNYSYGGNAEVDPQVLPFADQWNGTTWKMLPAIPVPANQVNSGLNAIACTSTVSCVAVGNTAAISEALLIEAWNGSAWSMQPGTVAPDAINSWLGGVSCASATMCFASGYEGHAQGPMTVLVEGWKGTTWSAQPAPSRFQGALTGMSCASPAFCMATGDIINAGPGIGPSALAWNGSSWSLVPTPGPAGSSNTLNAVSCFSASMCMAVGGSAPNRAEQWNGVTWSMVTTPQVQNSTATDLLGVVCPHTSVCTAVGSDHQPGVAFPWRTVAELWEAGLWRIQTTPNAS